MQMKHSLAATATAVALLAGGAATATAAQDSAPAHKSTVSSQQVEAKKAAKLTPLYPKKHKKNGKWRIYAQAKVNKGGKLPKGAVACVSLLQAHPYTPDLEVANSCSKKKRRTGLFWTSAQASPCGSYKSLSYYKYKGKTHQFKRSRSVAYCI
ncbi:hypothetical protein ACQB60_33640 [Actinomycetota bacterium Odt1-20B]